ncbi:MAG: hypothetical protein ACJ71N_10365 [Terriglobales bacterium]|jgi:hypothetical protein
MAAKKTVYVARSGGNVSVRKRDVDKLKKAFAKMMNEYVRLKEQQRRFEASAAELCGFWLPWTIPRHQITRWTRELRQR